MCRVGTHASEGGRVLGGLVCSKVDVGAIWTSTKPPKFVFSLQEKVRPDRPTDRYRSTLNGTKRPERAVWTIVGGLSIAVGDALTVVGLPHRGMTFVEVVAEKTSDGHLPTLF